MEIATARRLAAAVVLEAIYDCNRPKRAMAGESEVRRRQHHREVDRTRVATMEWFKTRTAKFWIICAGMEYEAVIERLERRDYRFTHTELKAIVKAPRPKPLRFDRYGV